MCMLLCFGSVKKYFTATILYKNWFMHFCCISVLNKFTRFTLGKLSLPKFCYLKIV